ncbi:hypothetical protein HanIR_Chr07g0334621 [Helianthus annuus]|nr:hypothetical protein HanIR_Chr07g0334621 [Helianthus annuus]
MFDSSSSYLFLLFFFVKKLARNVCNSSDKMYELINKDKPYEEPKYSVDEEDFVKVHGSDFVSLLCQNLFMVSMYHNPFNIIMLAAN